jgi:hypothetical protein
MRVQQVADATNAALGVLYSIDLGQSRTGTAYVLPAQVTGTDLTHEEVMLLSNRSRKELNELLLGCARGQGASIDRVDLSDRRIILSLSPGFRHRHELLGLEAALERGELLLNSLFTMLRATLRNAPQP